MDRDQGRKVNIKTEQPAEGDQWSRQPRNHYPYHQRTPTTKKHNGYSLRTKLLDTWKQAGGDVTETNRLLRLPDSGVSDLAIELYEGPRTPGNRPRSNSPAHSNLLNVLEFAINTHRPIRIDARRVRRECEPKPHVSDPDGFYSPSYEVGEINLHRGPKAGGRSASSLSDMDEGDHTKSGIKDDMDTPPTEDTQGHTPKQDQFMGARDVRKKPSSIHIRVPANDNISNISINVDPSVMSDVRIDIGRGGP